MLRPIVEKIIAGALKRFAEENQIESWRIHIRINAPENLDIPDYKMQRNGIEKPDQWVPIEFEDIYTKIDFVGYKGGTALFMKNAFRAFGRELEMDPKELNIVFKENPGYSQDYYEKLKKTDPRNQRPANDSPSAIKEYQAELAKHEKIYIGLHTGKDAETRIKLITWEEVFGD